MLGDAVIASAVPASCNSTIVCCLIVVRVRLPASSSTKVMRPCSSAYRDAALQRAEGEKVTRVKAAEAEAEATYLQGLGISRQRQVRVPATVGVEQRQVMCCWLAGECIAWAAKGCAQSCALSCPAVQSLKHSQAGSG